MKCLRLAAVALALALATSGCRSANSSEPLERFEPAGAELAAGFEDSRQLSPAIVIPGNGLTGRQQVASEAVGRLEQLDERVAGLRARCADRSACFSLEPGFKQLLALRGKVVAALANFGDPMVGRDAGEHEVAAALSELTVAIEALAVRIEAVDPQRTM